VSNCSHTHPHHCRCALFFVVSDCSHTHPHHCRCALFLVVSDCSHTHPHHCRCALFVVSDCSHTHPHHCRCALFFVVSDCSRTHPHHCRCALFVCYSRCVTCYPPQDATHYQTCQHVMCRRSVPVTPAAAALSRFLPRIFRLTASSCVRLFCFITLPTSLSHFIASRTLAFLPSATSSAAAQPNRCFPCAMPYSHVTFHSVQPRS
jgi:hypothetical protein